MKILNIKTLRGPNYWSNYRKKLIDVKLDLEEYENYPSNKLPGFPQKLEQLLPSLYSHYCSVGSEGGFLKRLEQGTWLGHIIEHIALELQTLAGMDCGFGRTYGTKQSGVYHVIFSYQFAEAGLYAARAAVNIADTLARGAEYLNLNNDLAELRKIYEKEKFGPSTESIIKAAEKKGIPYYKSPSNPFIVLGQGQYQKKIWATVSSETSSIGVDIAGDKELTKQLLNSHYIPVPKGDLVHSLEELENALKKLEFPLVIKPYNSNHGRGITTNIVSKEKAMTSFLLAHEISDKVIVEEYIQGCDYRLLVINYKVVAVAQRTPAMIIGDGKNTIQQLIDEINEHPLRGTSHENYLTKIKIDKITKAILQERNLTLDSVLKDGEKLFLKDAANLSSGGTAIDVTAEVHPYNLKLAARVARLVGLDICGIDIISPDIKLPLHVNKGAVIEVNAGPGFRMHLEPGNERPVGEAVIDMLYPTNAPSRIPLIAVTGTNGKTTVVRILAQLAKEAGNKVGYTTTDGIYIDDELIYAGDCSGPVSAETVLLDPLVNFAVLECARGGIIRAGLGFDHCDISIITNIDADHLGLEDIETIEDLTEVKEVVALSTKKDGYTILNAEDDCVYSMKKNVRCKVALFSLTENERIIHHCNQGGLAAYVKNGTIIIQDGIKHTEIEQLKNIPLTFNGTSHCMTRNALACTLAGYIAGFDITVVKNVLQKFMPSAENNPGRMNIFNFDKYKVMLDYAHNAASYQEIQNYLQENKYKHTIGIIGALGDRRPEDIKNLGAKAAQMFDEIIIRHYEDQRGREDQELTELLLEGINAQGLKPKTQVISNELEAIKYAMDHADSNTFIFYSVDNVQKAISYLKNKSNSTDSNVNIQERSLL